MQHFIATLRVVEGIWLLNWLKRSIDESATGCHEWRNTAVLSLFHFLINPFTNVVTGIRVNTVLPLLLCCRSILIPCRKCVFLCVSTLITTYCITREWLPNMVCSYFASVLMKPTTRPKEHIRGGKYWWSEGVTWMRISHVCVFPVVYTCVLHGVVHVRWCQPCNKVSLAGEGGIKFLQWNVSWILLPPGDQRAVGHQWTISGSAGFLPISSLFPRHSYRFLIIWWGFLLWAWVCEWLTKMS